MDVATPTLDTTAEVDFGNSQEDSPAHIMELVPIKSHFQSIQVNTGQSVNIGRKEEFGHGCFFKDTRISTVHCSLQANDDNTVTLCELRFVFLTLI
jgi:hypothetical protein